MLPSNLWLFFLVALIPPLIGSLYYGPLFGKAWMRESDTTEADIENSNMIKIMGLSYLFSLIIAFNLPFFVVHQTALGGLFGMLTEQWLVEGSSLMTQLDSLNAEFDLYARHRHFGHGALHGGAMGLLFVAPIICVNGLFERRSWHYLAIHAGYWTISLALMGGLLCQFLVYEF